MEIEKFKHWLQDKYDISDKDLSTKKYSINELLEFLDQSKSVMQGEIPEMDKEDLEELAKKASDEFMEHKTLSEKANVHNYKTDSVEDIYLDDLLAEFYMFRKQPIHPSVDKMREAESINNEMLEALEQLLSRQNDKTNDTWLLKAIYMAKAAIRKYKESSLLENKKTKE